MNDITDLVNTPPSRATLVDFKMAADRVSKGGRAPLERAANAKFWLDEREQKMLDDGTTPFEYLLSLMRDEFQPPEIRFKAATALLPYAQRRAPQAMELSGPDGDAISLREGSAARSKLAALVGLGPK